MRAEINTPHHLVETSDGLTLFLRSWSQPVSEASDVAVLILHGITAHSGPYAFLGKPLSENGFPTFGLDIRGHGLSDGQRGDYPSKERFAKDLCETISFLRETYPKVVLLGHSMGVLSAITILNNCIEGIDGAILLSGARTIRPDAMPAIPISTKLKIVFNSIFFRSKPVIHYYREGMVGLDDPLFNFMYTLRFIKMNKTEDIELPDKLGIPFFVGVGDYDELFSEISVRELFDEIPVDDKTFHVFEGAKHAEFPEESWVPLLDWLKKHFDK
ncbi:MAG: alpha/beta fold hydrolase [Candidatus Thorarchaeota archaeon]